MAKALTIALWVQVAGIPDPLPRAGLRAPADFLSFLSFGLWGTPASPRVPLDLHPCEQK